jgi:hypothetical protein
VSYLFCLFAQINYNVYLKAVAIHPANRMNSKSAIFPANRINSKYAIFPANRMISNYAIYPDKRLNSNCDTCIYPAKQDSECAIYLDLDNPMKNEMCYLFISLDE